MVESIKRVVTALRDDTGLDFLPKDGEVERLIHEYDWSATPLGHPSQWSPSLRMVVRFMLANRFPHLLWWGPDYIQIYNDHYIPILGTKHPHQALGKPVRECWHEIYHILGPLVDTPFNGGPATWMEDIELIVQRHGFPEESHFTIAYSPVPDDIAPRGIGGVLATVHEITEKIIAERRVKILSELGARVAEAKTDEQACVQAVEILSQHPKDIPFALLYLLDEGRRELRLVSTTGISTTSAGPTVLSLDAAVTDVAWPLIKAIATETMQLRDGLSSLLASVPVGPWPDPPDSVSVVPIKSNIAHRPAGALVVGISAYIRVDERYRIFLELVGAQVATAVANARAYEEERRRAEALAEIDRAKTTFFSNVSHEFRTPLTLMLGPLDDALSVPQVPAPVRMHLETAQRNAQRLLKLVNSLLDFARIEAGRTQASFAPVDLAALTADLSSTFRSAMQRAQLEFDVDCRPVGEPVYVDREMWEKIVLNLLSNAFKFTMQGAVRVRLGRDDGRAVLEVSDTGVGVPEHEIARLFDRFHRVEGTQARTHEGSGIGLALVQELVKLHGGSIDVTSELGAGTTFRVRLQFGTAHLPPERIKVAPSLASTAVGAQAYVQEALRWLPDDGGTSKFVALTDPHAPKHDGRFASTFGARVLLADDNADMRMYVRELLNSRYNVEAVTDGAEALEAARRARPDLILCDVMMPRMNGFDLLKTLRADAELRDVPIIMLSARAGEESRIEGLGAGADDYIVKPFHARELLARIGALLELTDVRRDALERQRRQLEEADRHKNEFLAMLAHELRNPLAPIRNAGELLSRTLASDPQARSALATVERQVKHLTRLVDDLLDISRITQGRIELRRSPVRVDQVIAHALEAVDPLIRQKQHQVAVVSSRQRLTVNGDPERLVQCVGNILTNAAKYTPANGEIRVESRQVRDEAVVTIRDNGVGIPPELMPKVFDLFIQGERTLDRPQGGLGVGLTIVRRLIEMHGGSIAVTSEGAGRGAAFEIRLPLAQEAQPTATTAAAHERPRRPHKILLVDDNADGAFMLAELLRFDGHEVETAVSGVEALERMNSFRPDVALLDIGLPGLDGYEVARLIRERSGSGAIRLIAITGYGTEADRERARDAGFVAHLVKPIEFSALERVLNETGIDTR
jgi:signal transduction histidine kinase